ncbi:uncharacterized protein DFL_005660 [Arthrobotrys flagrans]|uniref:CFEM domain-containing protein n=1 Tax=Arthrobotrys flagrans TaxID=97331 RepID=A0A436ZY45_ARTFL|nr:hypothetical protein DFL_005660 [Arthrobotrys flagrans]
MEKSSRPDLLRQQRTPAHFNPKVPQDSDESQAVFPSTPEAGFASRCARVHSLCRKTHWTDEFPSSFSPFDSSKLVILFWSDWFQRFSFFRRYYPPVRHLFFSPAPLNVTFPLFVLYQKVITMYYSILLSALVGISSVLAVNFGGQDLPGCTNACYKTVLGQPGLSKCDNKVLCLCDDYAILGAIQDCLNRTNDCGNGKERTDTIYQVQEVCDKVILDAAQPTTSASTSGNREQPAPTELPEPTSLEEAEGRLGASASALINERPYRLSTGAKAGIAVGSVIGFFIIAFIGVCCGCYHYKNHVIKKFNRGIQNSPAMPYPVEHNDDKKGGHNSWFAAGGGLNIKTHIRGATNDSHELGYPRDGAHNTPGTGTGSLPA